MIELYLYGKRRRFAPERDEHGRSVLRVEQRPKETLEMLLERVGIDVDEVYTIFLNAKLLTTRNTMAPWLGYQQVCEECHNWKLSIVLQDGSRLGLFGEDMAALVV